jgi:hypothetical protein
MSSNITWGSIFGIMIGSMTGVVMHSTSFGIGIGAAIAVVIALLWPALNRNRAADRDGRTPGAR